MGFDLNTQTHSCASVVRKRGVINMKELSKCCGEEMTAIGELGRFVEMQCSKCGDLVYMKQYSPSYSASGWKEGFLFNQSE